MALKKKAIPKRSKSPEVVFGNVMRELRTRKQISQEELAHVSGYSRNYIGLLERGEKSPSLRTLVNLGDALDVLPSEILKEIERTREHSKSDQRLQ